jgi:hypothetical protein
MPTNALNRPVFARNGGTVTVIMESMHEWCGGIMGSGFRRGDDAMSGAEAFHSPLARGDNNLGQYAARPIRQFMQLSA